MPILNKPSLSSHIVSVTARFTQRLGMVVLVASLFLLTWRLSDVMLLMFGAIIVAVTFHAMAQPWRRYLHVSSKLAVVIAVVLLMLLIIGSGWLIGDRLIAQIDNLRTRFPEALVALRAWANNHAIGLSIMQAWDDASVVNVPWAKIANVAGQTFNVLGAAGLMLVIGVYLAADPRMYRDGFVRLIPVSYRRQINGALEASGHALSRWLIGQGISMLFVGSSTAIGLAVLGMPLAMSLGVIAGVMAFIPFFGPIASGLLCVLLAFMEGPQQAMYVAVLCVAIQQVEGNLLMPFVQRWAVELPPVLGIIAAVIFGLLFGLAGVIFATPLMVVAMVMVQKLYIEGVLEAPNTREEGFKKDSANE